MRLRLGYIAFLLFQAAWLNLILPGHTRGMITVAGSDPCCRGMTAGSCPVDSGQPTNNRTGDERRTRCALCYFAARLTVPPAVDLRPPPLVLVETLAFTDSPIAASPAPIPAYDGRAPPLHPAC